MTIGIGDALTAAREEQGRTLDDASRATRVRADYLLALEEEDFAVLGGDVYAKGFLRTYARYLGLDPEPLLERYRSDVERSGYDPHQLVEHPVARQPRSGPPTWVLWAAVAAVAAVAALALVGTFGGRTPQPAARPSDDDPTAVVTGDDPSPRPRPTPTASPTPSPSPTGVELVLLVEDTSWVRVVEEEQELFVGTLQPGASRSFEADDELFLHLGNAGGVRLVLNGRELGSPGSRGEVWRGTCTETGCDAAA